MNPPLFLKFFFSIFTILILASASYGAVDTEALATATVLYYTMDNAQVSGSTIFDLTPNGNDGTIVGATTGVSGILNQGFSFDGDENYINTNWVTPWTRSSTFGVSTWIKFSGNSDDEWIMDQTRSGTSQGQFRFYFRKQPDNRVTVHIGSTAVSSREIDITGLDDNNFHNIIFLYDNEEYYVYVNSLLIESGTYSSAGTSISPSNLIIGAAASNPLGRRGFTGEIDETLILDDTWTSVGTAQEIVTYLFNNGNPTRLQQFPYTSTTQAIQGTVTLDGNPVEGADVRLINTTDDIYIGSFTTPADGTYSFTNLLSDKEYHALVQYKDGSNNEYNTLSLPFLSPEEVDDV